jgi:hypothetical protein
MKTENFTEAFKNNVNNTIKLFQDSTMAIIEAQSKQIEFASEICTKAVNSFESFNKTNFDGSFGTPEKIIETIQKNFENMSNMTKATLKTAFDFGKQTSSSTFSKEIMDTIIESYSKQTENIASFNQKYFDAVNKQFNATKQFFNSSLTEKLKKDFDSNLELSKEQLHAIIDSYNKITNPSSETNQSFFKKLNEQLDTMVNVNLKLWSDLIGAYSDSESGRTDANFAKNVANNAQKTRNKETVSN